MIDFDVQVNGADQLLPGGNMNLIWQYTAAQQESSLSFEKENTQVGYIEDGEFDYHTIGKTQDVDFASPVKWIGIRQRFFNTYLVAKNNFTSGKMEWVMPAPDQKIVMQSTSNMQLKLANGGASFSIYYGPADYHTLRKHDLKFEKLINLGQGPYAFVRPINRFVVMPVWDFIKGFVGNYGIVIALLTLFIRLLI